MEAQLKAQGLKPGVQAGYIPGMGPASKGQAANTAKAAPVVFWRGVRSVIDDLMLE